MVVGHVQAPLYTLKAKLFPGSTFVVGYDTAVRLVDAKYYGSQTQMLLQFGELAHLGCSFMVRPTARTVLCATGCASCHPGLCQAR